MLKINEGELEWEPYHHGDNEFRRKELSKVVEGDEIGCSLYELPPGKRSWPYHYHTANEEALFVLSGDGRIRTDEDDLPLESGDFVAFPANQAGGHQVVNDGDKPLQYLMVSTMNEPDVTLYPEMEKFGVFVGSPPGGRGERLFHGYYEIDNETQYWDE